MYIKSEEMMNFITNEDNRNETFTISIKKEPKDLELSDNWSDHKLNEIFLPEVKIEYFENENGTGSVDANLNDNPRYEICDRNYNLNEPTASIEKTKKSSKLQNESPESREKRLIRSKLYYKIRKAKLKGEHELIKMYEREKSKNKLETLEERAQRLASGETVIPIKAEDYSKRKIRLELLQQMKKIKDFVDRKKKLNTKSKIQKLEMLKLLRENRKKSRLKQLLVHSAIMLKSKVAIKDVGMKIGYRV